MASTTIILDRLRIMERDTESGTLRMTEVKVASPCAPCAQENAPGNLRGHETLELFRNSARASGASFRRALANERG
jgi:hypothetical protein